jgi:hypothetical protein
MEYTGWEWFPRAGAHPSEVEIEMVAGNGETQHEIQTHESDLMTNGSWSVTTGDVSMMRMRMRMRMRMMMIAAASWNLLLDDYR